MPEPAWLPPARKLIQAFEGCELHAYPDPASGGEPWTIGWGATFYANGNPVKAGDRISQADADWLLDQQIRHFADGLQELLTGWSGWGANQQAALISWAFNVGLGAVMGSTMRRRLNRGESLQAVAAQELPRWVMPGSNVEAGLMRRRRAEMALLQTAEVNPLLPPAPAAATTSAPAGSLPSRSSSRPLTILPVRQYYTQRDNGTKSARTCFSSTCAMLVKFLKPAVLMGVNADLDYLKIVERYGDTTESHAQIAALKHYGIKARFTQTATFSTLEQQIAKGFPVPCGYLHRGPVSAPAGGGHWLLVYGHTPLAVKVMDPWGESDLITGGTVNSNGKALTYSRRNWGPRWLAGPGPSSGWAILVDAVDP